MKLSIPQFIGARVRRREDPALITGQGKYVADFQFPGTLHMVFVRSPHAHAKVVSIDAGAAETAPGVFAVLTAEDVNGEMREPLPVFVGSAVGEYESVQNPDRFALATDRVRHVGDPVALILAESVESAVEAAELVFVDYDPFPSLSDPEAALEEGATVLHPQWADNRGFVWSAQGGNVEEAFENADVVVELRARVQRLIANAMEPRAVQARPDPEDGRTTVWSSTQVPHTLRDSLASILDIDRKELRVVAPEVGGGFGVKSNVHSEEVLACLLARRFGRPICWVASRSEDYLATAHGRDQIDTIRLAADAQGRISAADLRVIADCGAFFSGSAAAVSPLTGLMMNGVYDIPNLRVRATGVFTNKVCTEPYRGAGRPEACYMIERSVDLLAAKLGLDPVEVRRRNLIPADRFPYTTTIGARYDSGDYSRTLDRALDLVDYQDLRRRQAESRESDSGDLMGIGVSCYVEICGFGPWESGTVSVESDGKVTVLTGTSPHGQGHLTSWAQLAADILQVPLEQVAVRSGDTDVVPRGIGTFGSRSAAVGGSAVKKSSEVVVERAKEIASHLLEAAPADIRLEGGRFQVVGVPGSSVDWQQVAEAGHSENLPPDLDCRLSEETRFEPKGETYPFGVHVCVVKIDRETGDVKIERYLCVDDCGPVINPLIVEGQVHGGIVQGVGQALFERAFYDEQGNLLTGTLMDYVVPRADRLPEFENHRTETRSPLNDLGVKGIGEAATIGSTPAVVNAVVDALSHLGVEHIDTPLTSEKIWRVLRARSAGLGSAVSSGVP